MISRPYNMGVTAAELNQTYAWWRNLSINQMKALEKKHFPTWCSGTTTRQIHQMWEEEKPEPQEVVAWLSLFPCLQNESVVK